jgi:hypothetical protein
MAKDYTGSKVTLDGKRYVIACFHGNDRAIIVDADGNQQDVAASWARWRARVYVADQSLVGKSFRVPTTEGEKVWLCVDRWKGIVMMRRPNGELYGWPAGHFDLEEVPSLQTA